MGDSTNKRLQNFGSMTDKQAEELNQEIEYDLTSPEKKYHTNKQQASQNIIGYLHQLLVKIAPMNKRQIRQVRINNSLIDKILAIFKSNDAKYLYVKCPTDTMGSTIFYLQFDDVYTGNAHIETTSLADSNCRTRSEFKFTKRAKTEFNHLKKMHYKYVHYYDKWGWNPVTVQGHKCNKNSSVVATQFNAPTKRDLIRMIKEITSDVSMHNISISDRIALEDKQTVLEKNYQSALKEIKADKADLVTIKQKLAKLRQYFKQHKNSSNHKN